MSAASRRKATSTAPLLVLSALAMLGAGCVKTTAPLSSRAQEGLRITYRVEDPTVTPAGIRTMVVLSSSPYLGSQITYDATSATPQSLVGGFLWTREGLFTIGDGGRVQETQPTPPEAAPVATHLLTALPVAEQQKVAIKRAATGTYLGRTCTTWSTKEPLDGAEFAAATSKDHTETCVDSEGLALREDWYIDGKLVRVREASAVETVKAVATADFYNGQSPRPVPEGIAQDQIADIALNAQSQGVTIKAPRGYALDRAVVVASAIPGEPTTQIASVGETDAFRKGQELMTLRRTRSLVGAALGSSKGAQVDLGALGIGRMVPISSGVEIRVVTKSGVLVVGQSTTSPDALVTWMRSAKLITPTK